MKMTRPAITHMRISYRLYPVDSLADASRMFRQALAEWPGHHAGVATPDLLAANGTVVGYVTHDGRCWLGVPGSGVCVHDPKA